MTLLTLSTLTAIALATAARPVPDYRIGTRPGPDGVYEFHDRVTGAAFRPRGFSYIRLDKDLRPLSPHSTFNPGLFDLERADRALATIAAHGYNTVRVLINGSAVTEADGGICGAYMRNLAAFLDRVREHGMQALLVLPVYIPSRHPANRSPALLADINWLLLAEEAVAFREVFLMDFIRALHELGAPRDAVLAYDLSELHFTRSRPPFSLEPGYTVTTASGEYRIENAEDADRMMSEGFLTFANRARAAVRRVAPNALLGVDLFPSVPFPNDPRFHDAAILFESDLDYIGLQLYPFFTGERDEAGMDALLSALHVPAVPGKPVLMEEFGSLKRLQSLDQAVTSLTTWVRLAEQKGIRGWILWTYDCAEQADPVFNEDFWLAVDQDFRLLRALGAPTAPAAP
jgi:hypothetical protein